MMRMMRSKVRCVYITNLVLTCYFGDAKGEAYGGVSKRHDCSNDGKPPYLIKVWNLRENDFRDAE